MYTQAKKYTLCKQLGALLVMMIARSRQHKIVSAIKSDTNNSTKF